MLKEKNKKSEPMAINHVAIILDESGSMWDIRKDAINTFNSWITDLKKESAIHGIETYLTVIKFSNMSECILDSHNVNEVRKLTEYDYKPSGQTALFSGVEKSIKMLSKFVDGDFNLFSNKHRKNISGLVIVITDGQENASGNLCIRNTEELIKNKTSWGNWTFAFLLPPGQKNNFLNRFPSVSSDNVMTWECSKEGLKEVNLVSTQSFGNYYRDRSMGQKSTTTFFATTDLSKVTKKVINKELDDVTSKYKIVNNMMDGMAIKEFVEEKTKARYILGSSYYQLMKKEKIQPNKDVIIMDKTTNKLYGGDSARQLIGLKDNEFLVVTPGNHMNYEVFVKSNSVNRKLSRGTKVLIKK